MLTSYQKAKSFSHRVYIQTVRACQNSQMKHTNCDIQFYDMQYKFTYTINLVASYSHLSACYISTSNNPQKCFKKSCKRYLNCILDLTSVVQIDEKSDSHSQNKAGQYFSPS